MNTDKLQKLVDDTMKRMEEEKFTVGETETFVNVFKDCLEKNSKLHEFYKPFTVFRFTENN